METGEIIALIGAAGGVQGVAELVKWWIGRKFSARKEQATLTAAEDENMRRQTDWLERRLHERDEKVDALYSELRNAQSELLNQIHRNHEYALRLKEAEIKKCNRRGCGMREPPGEY